MALVDGVLFDFGVLSMQFDDSERGFSLGKTARMDMRMDPRIGPSADEGLSTASESELADIFFNYGEERATRRLVNADRRAPQREGTSGNDDRFAAPISGVPESSGIASASFATRVFQALRIAVDDELDAAARRLG